jgi:hypothetical protein
MHSSGMLLPPPSAGGEGDNRTEGQKKLWQDSRDRIERVLPGFLDEVMPADVKVPQSVTA